MSGTDSYELPDRHVAQAEGTRPAPCARHCEANAYEITIRRLNAQLTSRDASLKELSCCIDTLLADRDFWKLGFEAADMAVQEVTAERDELLAALKPVLAISDRKHDAWDHAHALIAKHEGEKKS